MKDKYYDIRIIHAEGTEGPTLSVNGGAPMAFQDLRVDCLKSGFRISMVDMEIPAIPKSALLEALEYSHDEGTGAYR